LNAEIKVLTIYKCKIIFSVFHIYILTQRTAAEEKREPEKRKRREEKEVRHLFLLIPFTFINQFGNRLTCFFFTHSLENKTQNLLFCAYPVKSFAFGKREPKVLFNRARSEKKERLLSSFHSLD